MLISPVKSKCEGLSRRNRYDDAWWIVLITFALVVGAVVIGHVSALKQLLLVFGVLGGLLNALQNASIKRAIDGRQAIGELPAFNRGTFLVIAGLIGTGLGWVCLPLIYSVLATVLNYHGDLRSDLAAAIGAQVTVVGMSVPGFIVVGATGVISTYMYLLIVGTRSLTIISAIPIVTLAGSVLSGWLLFGEPPLPIEGVLLPLMVVFVVLLSLEERSSSQAQQQKASLVSFYLGALVYLALTVLGDLALKMSLADILEPQQFFVSLCFRPVYFSVYALPFLFWFARWVITDRRIPTRRQVANQVAQAVVTALTFTVSNSLLTPLTAFRLSIGPLLSRTLTMLTFPLVGALYKLDTDSPTVWGRLKHVYVPLKATRAQRFRYVITYGALMLIVLAWFLAKLGQ